MPAGPARQGIYVSLHVFSLSLSLPPTNLCRSSKPTSEEKLTIRRQRIRRRSQTMKMIIPLPIRPKLPPQIIITLILRILKVVFPVTRRLPDIHDGVWDSLLGGEVGHFAVHQGDLAVVRVLDYAAA